jgi:surface antigen
MSRWTVHLGIAIAVGLVAGCGAGELEETDELTENVPEEFQDDLGLTAAGSESGVSSRSSFLYGCSQCTNCVKYARCRQRRLPYGLTTWSAKLHVINRWRDPRAGCVAIIESSSIFGHVAYVRAVSGSRIYIDEGGYNGRCNSRLGTQAGLHIRGFFCP